MKRKYLSRILAVCMTAVLLTGVLAGCASGTDTPAPVENGGAGEETAAEGNAADQTASGDMPTLTWWTVGSTTPDDYEESMKEISKYTAEKLGVNLDIKVSGWGAYDQKMNTIVNAGEYFDLMFVNNTNYSKFVNRGALENLSEALPEKAPELYEFIPEQLWKGVQIKGSIYSVPAYKDSSSTNFWYLDDVYVQKYGIDMNSLNGEMVTLDPVFRMMKEGEGKGFYPVLLSQGSLWNGVFTGFDTFASGCPPIGVRIDDESRTVVSTLEQDSVMENLNMLHAWYKDGLVNPDANVLTESTKGAPFGCSQGWPSAVASWQSLQGVEKYDAVRISQPTYSTDTIQGSMNAISANSKYKEQALQVLQLVNTDSVFRDMLAYGVEGVHFEYVGEGVVKKLRDDWPLASYTQGTFFNMSITDDADPDQWEQVRQQNEEAISSVCLGFALDIENIQNEIANCNVVWDKYKYDLLTGASDPDVAVPKCLEELRAAGLDTIISEAQKQMDEFFE